MDISLEYFSVVTEESKMGKLWSKVKIIVGKLAAKIVDIITRIDKAIESIAIKLDEAKTVANIKKIMSNERTWNVIQNEEIHLHTYNGKVVNAKELAKGVKDVYKILDIIYAHSKTLTDKNNVGGDSYIKDVERWLKNIGLEIDIKNDDWLDTTHASYKRTNPTEKDLPESSKNSNKIWLAGDSMTVKEAIELPQFKDSWLDAHHIGKISTEFNVSNRKARDLSKKMSKVFNDPENARSGYNPIFVCSPDSKLNTDAYDRNSKNTKDFSDSMNTFVSTYKNVCTVLSDYDHIIETYIRDIIKLRNFIISRYNDASASKYKKQTDHTNPLGMVIGEPDEY